VGDLRTTLDGGLVPPTQMFALCGAMIVVGIAYICIAPQPPPTDPVALTAPTTELAAAGLPAGRLANLPASVTNARSVSFDTQANEAGAGSASVSTIRPSVPTTAPPTTIAGTTIPLPTTTTIAPLLATAEATTATLTASVNSVLSAIALASGVAVAPPPPPPAPPAAEVYGSNNTGIASWFNAPDNTCAHRTLPFGTTVKVTRVGTGAVAYCRVNDWGPTEETGRIIDLSMDTFAQLSSTSAGLINVTIEW